MTSAEASPCVAPAEPNGSDTDSRALHPDTTDAPSLRLGLACPEPVVVTTVGGSLLLN